MDAYIIQIGAGKGDPDPKKDVRFDRYTLIEKLEEAPPWGRKRGRSEEKEPKAKEDDEEDGPEEAEESKRGPRSLPRPPPGLKLNTV